MAELTPFSSPVPQGHTRCPECGTDIAYFDKQKSAYFACGNCRAFFKASSSGVDKVERKFNNEWGSAPCVPLGTVADFDGEEYTLVGFMAKKEANDEVYWDEYVFYRPGEKWYRILSEHEGHWLNIAKTTNDYHPEKVGETWFVSERQDHSISKSYELCLSYKFVIIYAVGEFDWNILDDEEMETYEFANAPVILVKEYTPHSTEWFRAVYTPEHQLAKMLRVNPAVFPRRTGKLPLNPAKFYPRYRPLMQFSGILLGLFLLVLLLSSVLKPQKDVLAKSYQTNSDTTVKEAFFPVVTESFDVDGPGALQLNIFTPLSNSWAEFDIVIINDETGKNYSISKLLEYYSGYDDGEAWSEGSSKATSLISNFPKGKYHLNIYTFAQHQMLTMGDQNSLTAAQFEQPRQLDFDIKVTQNKMLTTNIILMLLLITLYPLIQYIRKSSYEYSTWFDFPYGTYIKNKG